MLFQERKKKGRTNFAVAEVQEESHVEEDLLNIMVTVGSPQRLGLTW